MGFDALGHYFQSGWATLLGGAAFNWTSVAALFNLVTLIDIILVVLVLWWLWQKIKGTALAGLSGKVVGLLIVIFLAKLLGFLALFYIAFAGLIMLLIAASVIYQSDFRKIIEGEGGVAASARRHLASGEYDARTFITELAEAVTLLSKSKIPSLIVIKTDLSLAKLTETGTALNTPFNKDFVWDVFAHRSKLSAGAMIVKRGIIVSAGSTLTASAPKRFVFSPTNAAIQQTATQYDAVVIITYKDKEEVSVLCGKATYTKLAPKNLHRILKTILLD